MEINICGKYEDWTKEKVTKAMPEARSFQSNQMAKDFDEAWLSQWASNQTVYRLQLISEILDNPTTTVQTPVCPECGKVMTLKHGKGGGKLAEWISWEFWGCPDFPRCRGKLNMKQAEKATTIPVIHKRGITMFSSNYSYGIVREEFLENHRQPTIGEALNCK